MSTTAPDVAADIRRQARGRRRIDQLLDAAAEVFAEVGYAAATTNAVAARAGVPPGTLYQFFTNKQALAEGLAERFQAALGAVHADAFSVKAADAPLPWLVDRIVDGLIGFNLANPAFRAVFHGPETGETLPGVGHRLHQAVVARVTRLVEARRPDWPAARVARIAEVSVQIFKALLPLVVLATPEARPHLVSELKRALVGYLSAAEAAPD